MASIRLSEDVEAIAQQVSKQKGLNSTRVAVEAIVRCFWKEYLEGKCPATAPQPTVTPVQPYSDFPEVDAIAALDSVI